MHTKGPAKFTGDWRAAASIGIFIAVMIGLVTKDRLPFSFNPFPMNAPSEQRFDSEIFAPLLGQSTGVTLREAVAKLRKSDFKVVSWEDASQASFILNTEKRDQLAAETYEFRLQFSVLDDRHLSLSGAMVDDEIADDQTLFSILYMLTAPSVGTPPLPAN